MSLQDLQSFGYAGHFKAVVSGQNELNFVTAELGKLLNENQMKPNFKETHLLNIKKELSAGLFDNCVQPCKEQNVTADLLSKTRKTLHRPVGFSGFNSVRILCYCSYFCELFYPIL